MEVSKKIDFIKDWILNYVNSMPTKAESLVIGISGGIDSSVSSTLSAMTGLKTIVISMPIKQKTTQHDLSLKHQEWLKKNFKNVSGFAVELDDLFSTFEKTLSNFSFNQSLCLRLKSCCEDICLIGIVKTMVFIPVIAQRVLVTEESIPPDVPITSDSAFLGIEFT